MPDNPRRYENFTGCGNTLNLTPSARAADGDGFAALLGRGLHVDGFRFDLATMLGRGDHGFDRNAAFFTRDPPGPGAGRRKLIAEPWDLGLGGYQVGGFPRSGRMERPLPQRDAALLERRRRAAAASLPAACRLVRPVPSRPRAAAERQPHHRARRLHAARPVQLQQKHNEANGEDNRDGHDDNPATTAASRARPTTPRSLRLRARSRTMLATLLLAQGLPMLLAGDEVGNTQGGNNNAYCQDNATTWIDWHRADEALIEFTARLLRLRREYLPLGDDWYTGRADPHGVHDLTWLTAENRPLEGDDWNLPDGRCLAALIGAPGRRPHKTRRHRGPVLLLLVNADSTEKLFQLPTGRWCALFDSSSADGAPASEGEFPSPLEVAPRSVQLLIERGAL